LALPHPPSVVHRPDLATAAPPAAEPIGPATGEQILPAHLLRGEALLELHDRQREPRPRHPVKLRPAPDGKDRVCKSAHCRSADAAVQMPARSRKEVCCAQMLGVLAGHPRPDHRAIHFTDTAWMGVRALLLASSVSAVLVLGVFHGVIHLPGFWCN